MLQTKNFDPIAPDREVGALDSSRDGIGFVVRGSGDLMEIDIQGEAETRHSIFGRVLEVRSYLPSVDPNREADSKPGRTEVKACRRR